MPLRSVVTWFGFLLGTTALLLQFSLTTSKRYLEQGDSLFGTLAFFFTFFTILTNIMLVLIYLSDLTAPRWLSWWRSPVTRGMMAGAITLVGVFNHLVLSGLQTLVGWFWFADFLLHYVTPTLFVVWWLAFQPKGTLRFADIPTMLLPTLIWLVWAMLRGAVVGEYPYPILAANTLGYRQVAINCLFVFIGLVVIYLIVVSLDRLLGRAKTGELPSTR
jgi:hypothetical protein